MAGIRITLLFSLLFLAAACGSDYGHEVHGEKLTVYFVESSDQEAAEQLALYWKNNKMLTGKKQDIQLTRSGKTLQVRLIANDPKLSVELPFNERKILMELQDTLGVVLQRTVEIVLCNNRFETVLNLNE
jgi:hypothetical protein